MSSRRPPSPSPSPSRSSLPSSSSASAPLLDTLRLALATLLSGMRDCFRGVEYLYQLRKRALASSSSSTTSPSDDERLKRRQEQNSDLRQLAVSVSREASAEPAATVNATKVSASPALSAKQRARLRREQEALRSAKPEKDRPSSGQADPSAAATRRSRSGPASESPKSEQCIIDTVSEIVGMNASLFITSSFVLNFVVLKIMECVFVYTTNRPVDDFETSLPAAHWLFNVFWFYPIILVTKIWNSLKYMDIDSKVQQDRKERQQLLSSMSLSMADLLLSTIVQAVFQHLCKFVWYLANRMDPWSPFYLLLHLAYFVMSSLLTSLFCFEYKWCNRGLSLNRRLDFVEDNWPYFVGFGLPLNLLGHFLSYVLSDVLSVTTFSIGTPLLIMSAYLAEVKQPADRKAIVVPRMYFFKYTVNISTFLFRKSAWFFNINLQSNG